MEDKLFDPKYLKQMRREAGFYQKDLAHILGVSRETVLHIEKGKPSSVRSLELNMIRRWYEACAENTSSTTKGRFARQLCEYLGIEDMLS